MTHDLVIRNCRIFNRGDARFDVAIDADQVTSIRRAVRSDESPIEARREVDATGQLLLPALIDGRARFRVATPGSVRGEIEGFTSGTLAAAHGGCGVVLEIECDGELLDRREALERKLAQGRETGRGRVGLFATATAANLPRLGELAESAVGFHVSLAPEAAAVDRGQRRVSDHTLMAIFEAATRLGKGVVVDPEEGRFLGSATSKQVARGRSGWGWARPPTAEIRGCERAIRLARRAGVRLHLAPITTAGGVDLIEEAKQDGVLVTAGTAPHYLLLTDDDLQRDPTLKVTPPLRGDVDRGRLRQGVRDGVIDVLESDHYPRAANERPEDFSDCAPGVASLDAFLPTLLQLLADGVLTNLEMLVDRSGSAPASIWHLPNTPSVTEGREADLVLVDDRERWRPTAESIESRGVNFPYFNTTFPGRVVSTWIAGRQTWPQT